MLIFSPGSAVEPQLDKPITIAPHSATSNVDLKIFMMPPK